MKATFHDKRKASDDQMKTYDSKLENLTKMVEKMMVQIQSLDSPPDKTYSPKNQYSAASAPDNKNNLLLEGGHYKKMVACGISKTRSDHQSSMNSSSRNNSKATLLWTSITSTTTSRCVLMW